MPPAYEPDVHSFLRKLSAYLGVASKGKLNATLDVTLTASSTTTVVKDARIGNWTAVIPTALTASGKTAIVAGIYYDTYTPPTGNTPPAITLHHASNAATDQNLRLALIG